VRKREIADTNFSRGVSYPREHAENGVYIYGDARRAEYGLSRDAYEGHAVLQELELLRHPSNVQRHEDGTMTISFAKLPSRYDPHRFQLVDEGLAEKAVPTMLKLLDRQLADA